MNEPERILVVDDERATINLIRAHFEAQGHSVACALDGGEGIALLEQEDFDRVFVDAMIPYVDGFEVLAWIRRHPTKNGTWVALMTAMANEIDGAQRTAIGADHYVAKPIDLSTLLPYP